MIIPAQSIDDGVRRLLAAKQDLVQRRKAATELAERVDRAISALGKGCVKCPSQTPPPPPLMDAVQASIDALSRMAAADSALHSAQQQESSARSRHAEEVTRGSRLSVRLLDAVLGPLGRTTSAARQAISTSALHAAEGARLAAQAKVAASHNHAEKSYGALTGAATLALPQERQAVETARNALIHCVNALPTSLAAAWTDHRWQQWSVCDPSGKPTTLISPYLRIGQVNRSSHSTTSPWVDWVNTGLDTPELPVLVPFIGSMGCIIVTSNARDSAAALSLVQSMVLRISAMMGPLASFTLLDPVGNGRAFPFQRYLKSRPPSNDPLRDLQEVESKIREINHQLLDPDTPLHMLPERRLASEAFEFVVAGEFPRNYDRRMIQALVSIGESGPRAGRYVIIHHNADEPFPNDMKLEDFRDALKLQIHHGHLQLNSESYGVDALPDPATRDRIFSELRNAEREPNAIPFDDLVDCSDSTIWTESSRDHISTPIGLRGGHDAVSVWFGAKDGRTCAHGMLAGMPGSGKSTLYHVMIMGMATRYSPDELKLYLVDGKFGTEFLPYSALPHARVVSLNTHPDLARSVLQELVSEMGRRNRLFRDQGVEDLPRYRLATGQPLERIVLMVDEYQLLFEGDQNGEASDLLRRLAQQGRSAGIHMFLGSQRFGAQGMVHQQDIFSNIHLKVAMKLLPDEVMGLTEFGRVGKAIIRDCDVAGKFALNDSGQDDRTIPGRASLLEPNKRDALIERLRLRAGGKQPTPTVLYGNDAPTVQDHGTIRHLLQIRPGPSQSMLEQIARSDPSSGIGFGCPGWQGSEYPVGLALGKRLTVHQHAIAMLRRSIGQHLLLIGSRPAPRLGMVSGALVSAIACSTGGLSVDVIAAAADPTDPVHVTIDALQKVASTARNIAITVHRGNDAALAALSGVAEFVEQRARSATPPVDNRIVLLLEPERLPSLLRSRDPLSSDQSVALKYLRATLSGGSLVGVHVVLASASMQQLAGILDERRDLPNFIHRASLQVTDDDSFLLFRNRRAASLQDPEDPVSMALYADMETNASFSFRPYAPLGMSAAVTMAS